MNRFTRRLFSLYDLARLDTLGNASVNNKHFLIACMPKSGSTYLSSIISNLQGFSRVSLVPNYDRREQELDYLSLAYCNRLDYVAQHHVRWSNTLSNQLSEFSLKPVVLVRNIFDACVSMRDHYRREEPINSMAWANQEMVSWKDEKLDLFLASMVIPWYLSFYVGWLECENKCVVNYEDLAMDPVRVVAEIFDYYAVDASRDDIAAALDVTSAQNTRKNKAVQGRGSLLSDAAKARIYELAAFYSGYDLGPIGIH